MIAMAASTKKVHLPIPMGAPGGPESIFQDPPLWCGQVGDYTTPYTRDRHKATCKRCIERDRQHEEDVDYEKVKARRGVPA